MSKAYDYKNIIETIDGAASQFESCTTASEKILFEAAMNAARELEYDPKTGKIKTTTANIARLAKIKAKLNNATASNIYLQGVRKLAETFGVIYDEQLQYFRSNFAAKTLDEKSVRDKYAALKKATIENTIEGLTGQGLQANVTDAISRMLMTAVTSGEKYADLTEQLHQELISSQGKTGSLARYANTYATTAMTQYAGQQNRMFTDDLNIKWFRYVGSTIETTRRFCELLTYKEYIHISEIPEILKGRIEIGGEIKTCPINPKTELPYGLIEGTTPENFAVNVGGWNCRHQLVPVADEAVPKNIKEKLDGISNKNIEQTEEITDNMLLNGERYSDKNLKIKKTEYISKLMNIDTTRAEKIVESISNYTGTGYEFIRKIQRGENIFNKEKWLEKANNIESFILASPKWTKPSYRIIEVSAQTSKHFKTGQIIDMKGTSSWTADFNTALNFNSPDSAGDVKIIFVCKNGQKKGTSIQAFSKFDQEHEITCSNTAKWEIEKIEQKESYIEITVSSL